MSNEFFNFDAVVEIEKKKSYNQGRAETFDVMKGNCKHSHFTYDEDSHCSGYNYCMLKGFDCVCSFENCEKLKEKKNE